MQANESHRDARTSSLLDLLHKSQPVADQQLGQELSTVPEHPDYPELDLDQEQPAIASGASASSSLGFGRHSPRPSSISVDSLFRNISAPAAPPQQQQPSPAPSDISGTNVPLDANLSTTSTSTSSERQNALLSLLGSVGSPSSSTADARSLPRNTGSTQGSATETQGKALLEQLMGGGPAPESRASADLADSYPSPLAPPSLNSPPASHASSQLAQEGSRPSDLSRKSMFDFVSPFDALYSGPPGPVGPSPTKKKPVPPIAPLPTGQSVSPRLAEAGPAHSPFHPPRKTSTPELHSGRGASSRVPSDVESNPNPLSWERPGNPSHRNYRNSPDGESSFDSSSRPTNQFPQPPSSRASPAHFSQRSISPPHGGQQQESPAIASALPIQLASTAGAVRDQDSPSSSSQKETRSKREELRPKPTQSTVQQQQQAQSSKRVPPPTNAPPVPTYILDVTAPLESTSAAPGLTAVTPIALLKLENLYVQGTTIAVSGFIAYAMTRGRVRLIARSNGSRALLHLPQTFPSTTSATDMVVNGNQLACVTSDGGVVVWDVPAELDDNPPVSVLLHVSATEGAFGLKLVKWHPKQAGTLALASDREVYVFNIQEAFQTFKGEEVTLAQLGKIAKVISVNSPLVSFTFDAPQIALATVSIDSTITLWSIRDKLPFWSGRVLGEGLPSSIDFLDGGLLVGRKQGTVLQFLPIMSAQVASTIKFTVGSNKNETDDESIFCHMGYDPRIKTLWVAHSARSSLFAVRLVVDSSPAPAGNSGGASDVDTGPSVRPTIDQIVEFPTPMQCINMAILVSEEYDSTTAVASFAMHQGGVDQVNIGMETYENALAATGSKLPPAVYVGENKAGNGNGGVAGKKQQGGQGFQQHQQQQQRGGQATTSGILFPIASDPVARPRTPPSEGEAPEVATAPKTGKGNKTPKGKEKEKSRVAVAEIKETFKPEPKDKEPEAMSKDLRKVEENLHTRLGKLLSKELDKQQQRIEELRRADQEADFARQETILKLISNELTKNTTRVVEQAVKSEVQNTVLPALENITKNEIKAALNGQIAKGLADSMKQTLPNEIERLLLRPDVSAHVARTFSSTVTPLVERHVKDAITKTLIPAYTQANNAMHVELSREITSEILNLKKEIVTWQAEALRGTESVVREMEQSLRTLSDQVRTLTLQIQNQQPPPQPQLPPVPQHRSSPVPLPFQHQASQQQLQHPLPHHHLSNSFQLRQGNLGAGASLPPFPSQLQQPMMGQAPLSSSQQGPGPSMYGSSGMWPGAGPSQQQQSQQQPMQQQQPSLSQSYNVQPQMPPQQQQQQQHQPRQLQHSPPPQQRNSSEDWDEVFLGTLSLQDSKQLRELLARCNPEIVMPSKGPTPLSQAVVLTLIHRLSESLPELSPSDESFKLALWWLQRAAHILNPNDPVIQSYVSPVLATAQSILAQTANRLNMMPGAPTDMYSMISQIQRVLSKPS